MTARVPPAVSCRYGAPMGRPGARSEPDCPGKFRLTRLRLVAGGYDVGGAYWGGPATVYWATCQGAEDVQECFVRSASREDAKRAVRTVFHNARFFR